MVIRKVSRKLAKLVNLVFFCAIRVESLQVLNHHHHHHHGQESRRSEFASDVNIVGGTPAVGDYNFYVLSGGQFQCGATLIYPDIVLTAAHCVTLGGFVDIGTTLLDGSNAIEKIDVAYELPHPDYNNETAQNDIMLVKLISPSSVRPVRLNLDPTLPSVWQNVRAIGFGHTRENGTLSDVLLQVDIQAYSDKDCVAHYPGLNPDKQFCAGVPQGGRDTCQGDSGGPLLDPMAALVQYGIVSFGEGCARPDSPGVYTRVSAYADWIQQFICENSGVQPLYCTDPPSITGFPETGALELPCNGNITDLAVDFVPEGFAIYLSVEGIPPGMEVDVVNDLSSASATINWSPPTVSRTRARLVFILIYYQDEISIPYVATNLSITYPGRCIGASINGTGWFRSPLNAWSNNTAATGRADIQFYARYKAAQKKLVGNMNFTLIRGSLNFTSSSVDWLRITKTRCAKLHGAGYISGDNVYNYMFILTICDVSKNFRTRTIRVQIWKAEDKSIIYDNLPGLLGYDNASYNGTKFNCQKRMIY